MTPAQVVETSVTNKSSFQNYPRPDDHTTLLDSNHLIKLVRQSQIVQSVMQDYQYDLSHLLPVCNLLVQGPKITYNYYCFSRRSGLLWCFTLNFVHSKFIHSWTSKRDIFNFSAPIFVTWYFCFPRKVCNMIPLFSQKNIQRKLSDMLASFLLESNEIIILLMKEKDEEWFCFIQEVNFHFINKQLLI